MYPKHVFELLVLLTVTPNYQSYKNTVSPCLVRLFLKQNRTPRDVSGGGRTLTQLGSTLLVKAALNLSPLLWT